MFLRPALLGLASTLLALAAGADEISIPIEGEVPDGPEMIEAVEIDADPFAYAIDVDAPASGEDRYRHEVVGSPREGILSVASHVFLPEPTQPLLLGTALLAVAAVRRIRATSGSS